MPKHEITPNHSDYNELWDTVASNPPENNTQPPSAMDVYSPDTWPKMDPADPWYNYDGPFDGDYAQNRHIEEDGMVPINLSGEFYGDNPEDHGVWVKKSDLYPKERNDDTRDF